VIIMQEQTAAATCGRLCVWQRYGNDEPTGKHRAAGEELANGYWAAARNAPSIMPLAATPTVEHNCLSSGGLLGGGEKEGWWLFSSL
jgi:hypothetical protein